MLFVAAAALTVLASCKKETETVTVYKDPAPSMEGAWEGYYGSKTVSSGGDTTFYNPTYGYSMVLKSGGKATVYSTLLKDTTASSRAEGTWVYSTDNKIVVDYTYVSASIRYIIRANVDPKMKAVNGKWYSASNAVGGLFYMVKQ